MPNNTLQTEIEVKFFDVSLDDTRNKLQTAGASMKTPERTMRRVVFGGEANPGMACTYGRVRDEGDVVTMSAKYSAVNNEITSQKEIMLTIDSFENAVAMLQAFGLTATDHQENKRETWQMPDGTLVELETWPDLPCYIEIEGSSVDAIKATALLLDMDWDSHITDPTGELYRRHHSLTDEALATKMSDLRFVK